MRRFSTIAIVALVGLVASCQRPQAGPPVETASAVADAPALRDPVVTVQVTCPDANGSAGGVNVHPWTVHVPGGNPDPAGERVTWHLVPAHSNISAVLEQTNQQWWPFELQNYHFSDANDVSVQLRDGAAPGNYPYRLMITCPGPDNQVIVIDPIVIVDP